MSTKIEPQRRFQQILALNYVDVVRIQQTYNVLTCVYAVLFASYVVIVWVDDLAIEKELLH